MTKLTGNIAKYKDIVKRLKITHLQIADYTGMARETTTLLLNGYKKPPIKKALHLEQEILEMIEKHSTQNDVK